MGGSFNRVFGPEVDRNFGGETMRPQTRWRAIRVSVFGRRPMSRGRGERGGGGGEGRDVTRPKPNNPSGRIPDLYVPVISLAIEIPWTSTKQGETSCVRDRFQPCGQFPPPLLSEYLNIWPGFPRTCAGLVKMVIRASNINLPYFSNVDRN